MSDNSFPTMAAGRRTEAENGRIPVAILLFLILAIMVPIEFSFYLGPLFMTASRTYLIILTFLILPRLGELKLRLFDWFFIGHVAWTCVAFLLIYPVGQSIEMAGSYGLEFLVVYLATRIFFIHIYQIRAVIWLIFILVCVSGAIALPEALTGFRYAHEIGEAITGIKYHFRPEIRMGIYRATSFFEHPILYGVFCASSLGLVWFVSKPFQRIYRAPIIALATWLSASSAPLLTLLVMSGLLVLEYLSRNLKRRDKFLAWGIGALVIILETFTGRGVVGIITMMTLSPNTAHIRRAQWVFGIDDVMRSPWFGFKPELYTRPEWLTVSIDNWWLLIMMRSGIPSLILLACSILFLWIAIARREGPHLFTTLRTAWGMTMIALILSAATVTFFGKLQPLFAFYMGMGAALAACELPSQGNRTPQAPTGRQGPRYTRFANRTQLTPASENAADRPPVQFRRDHKK